MRSEAITITEKAEKAEKVLDSPVQYHLVRARSILTKVKAMFPLSHTLNPYRGCRHACVYCFARPTHTYYNLNAGADFHNQIFVKVNAPELLRVETSKPSWKREPVCIGSVTDPYQPAETRYHLTRGVLEVFCEIGNPVDIITKSSLILEDLDLLTELKRRNGGRLTVNMSLITLDEKKARLLDPGAPSPAKRLATMAKLSAAGIKTRMFIMPIMPGITDDPDELEALVRAGAEAGIHSVAGDTFRIARGLEDYFHSFLVQHYPDLQPRYDRLYKHGRSTMAASAYKDAARAKIDQLRTKYHLGERPTGSLDNPAELEQALEQAENRAALFEQPHQLSFQFASELTAEDLLK